MLDHAHPSPVTTRPSLAARLNAEWHRIATDPASAVHMMRWPSNSAAAPYRSPATLLAATGRDGGLPMAEADQVLAAIVRLAPHDELAARIVLQRMIPPLVMVAARRTRSHPADRQALFDDLVATAWLVIRAYPIDRRPIKIAVNILRDSEYLTCVRPARLRSAAETPTLMRADTGGQCALDGEPMGLSDAASEVASLLSLGAAAGLNRTDLAIVAHVHLLGDPVAEVAERFAITTRTVRKRRALVASRLAALVA